MKEEGGLGAAKEMREKYSGHQAFNLEEMVSSKRAKTEPEKAVFKLPEDKPALTDLRIEPKDYFAFLKSQKSNLSRFESDGKAGSSFSCTTIQIVTNQNKRELSNDEMRKAYVDIVKSKQAKGLVLMLTSLGPIRVLINCDLAPKTSENFLELC